VIDMFLWTAFLIGLIGSFHCAGMCGPIALSIPLKHGSWLNRINGGLLYNSGRIITYVVLGAIFGLLGKGLHLAGFQLWTSVVIGGLMFAYVLFPLIFGSHISIDKLFGSYSGRLYTRFQKLFQAGSTGSLFSIGLLNGILPCGMVYVGIAGAVDLGTVPVMLSVSMAGNFISLKLRNMIGRVTPYIIILLGVLFILRGLSLGIPYLSPKAGALTPVVENAHKCCHK